MEQTKYFDKLFLFSWQVKNDQIFVKNHTTGKIYEKMYHKGSITVQESVLRIIQMARYSVVGATTLDEYPAFVARKKLTAPKLFINELI